MYTPYYSDQDLPFFYNLLQKNRAWGKSLALFWIFCFFNENPPRWSLENFVSKCRRRVRNQRWKLQQAPL